MATLAEQALERWRKLGDLEAIGMEIASIGLAASAAGDTARGRSPLWAQIPVGRRPPLPQLLRVGDGLAPAEPAQITVLNPLAMRWGRD